MSDNSDIEENLKKNRIELNIKKKPPRPQSELQKQNIQKALAARAKKIEERKKAKDPAQRIETAPSFLEEKKEVVFSLPDEEQQQQEQEIIIDNKPQEPMHEKEKPKTNQRGPYEKSKPDDERLREMKKKLKKLK